MTYSLARQLRRLAGALLCLVLTAATPAAGQSTKEVDDATKKLMAANGLLSRGLVKLAAEEYEAFLSKYPKHAQVTVAAYGLAVCRFRTGKYDEAAALLGDVLKDGNFKQRDEALAVLGHCRLATKAYDQALAALDELLRKFPDSKHAEVALLNRAQVLHMTGKHPEAVAACEEFLKKFPNSDRKTSAEYSLALAQVALGKREEAAGTLQKVLQSPNSPFALDATLLLGQCYEGTGKLDEAAGQYRKAVEIAPPDRRVEGNYSLGVVLYKADKYPESIKALTDALAGGSESRYAKPAKFQLGLAQLASGKLAEARKTLNEVAQKDTDRTVAARYWLAQCDMSERKYDSARGTLKSLAETKPAPPNIEAILYDKAICTMALGQHDEAAKEFAEFRKSHPDSERIADVTYREAFCLHKMAKYAESLDLCKTVASQPKLAIAPAAAELVAENLFLLGRYDEAVGAFTALGKTAKDELQKLRLAFRLSQCAYFRGDYAKAIELAGPLAGDKRVRGDASLREVVFLLGDAQLQTGKYPEAAATLAKYLAMDPKDKEQTQFKLGLAQLRSGDAPGADKTFQSLIRKDARSPWVQRGMFEYAQMIYKAGKGKEAAPVLDKLLSANPAEELAAPALYLQAWIDFDAKEYARAAQRFGDLARRFAKHELAADAAYQQGVCLVEAGKDAEALAALEAYVKAHPTGRHVSQARHHIGRCQTKVGRHADAVKVLAGLAADKKTVSDTVLYELAWAQREGKVAPEAVKTYRRLLAEYPKSDLATAARAELAELLYADGKYPEAAGLLEQVVADKDAETKTLALARYRLGWCYDKQGQDDKAAETFSRFAEADAASEFAPSAMYQAGVAYTKLGKLDEANKQFAALLAKFPKHDLAPVSMLKLGEIQAQQEDYARSGTTYEEFLKNHPDSKFAFLAQFGVGWAMENRRRYDDARKWYAKVIEAHNGPTAARAQFQMGECYFHEQKFEKAAGELLKVEIVYAYPEWSARALYEAGRAFEALKEPGQARSQYSLCVKKYKDSASAAQAAQRLKEMGEAGK